MWVPPPSLPSFLPFIPSTKHDNNNLLILYVPLGRAWDKGMMEGILFLTGGKPILYPIPLQESY